MMDKPESLVCFLKGYIQPFERLLAEKELEALTGSKPVADTQIEHIYRVDSWQSLDVLLDKLTFWEEIQLQGISTFYPQLTRQVRREATTKLAKNGIKLNELSYHLPFKQIVSLPTHRALRYGTHGIHEYRGKFFPQLVRSLLNIAGTETNAVVLDPMCGSGTTAVESVLSGFQVFGLDMNPLSVLISRAKCNILTTAPHVLEEEYELLRQRICNLDKQKNRKKWWQQLSPQDHIYLENWFPADVLNELDLIASVIQETEHSACRELFLVCLSNILRPVSWQKVDDLRVRREIKENNLVDALTIYLAELESSTKSVLALLYENAGVQVGQAHIKEGDARKSSEILIDLKDRVDVIITSPPYATALPYLDTDRLSLSYLNLLARQKHRQRDHQMIGNREITNKQHQQYWAKYQKQRHLLPDSITTIIDHVHLLNTQAAHKVGFRRHNLAALLANYFLDMRDVLQNFVYLLKQNAPAYVVVGNNHTIAGGQNEQDGGEKIFIETDQFLAQLGETVGLEITEIISMEMLTSRDIFKKNAGTGESIICFRNPH